MGKSMCKMFCVIAALVLSALIGSADTRSSQIMERMASIIKQYGQYQVEFAFRADAASQPVTGRCVVQGDKYYLSAEGMEVYCDGKVKYEVNNGYKEVTVDRVDPADKSILANPAKVFDFPDAMFSHSYSAAGNVGTSKCDMITLKPKDTDSAIVEITLSVDQSTGLPLRISYRLDGVSSAVSVDIYSIKRLESVPAAQFTFDKSKYKSFEIIDFR